MSFAARPGLFACTGGGGGGSTCYGISAGLSHPACPLSSPPQPGEVRHGYRGPTSLQCRAALLYSLHLHGANPGCHANDPRMGAKAHSIRELLDIRDGITTLADFDTDDVRVILDELCRS